MDIMQSVELLGRVEALMESLTARVRAGGDDAAGAARALRALGGVWDRAVEVLE